MNQWYAYGGGDIYFSFSKIRPAIKELKQKWGISNIPITLDSNPLEIAFEKLGFSNVETRISDDEISLDVTFEEIYKEDPIIDLLNILAPYTLNGAIHFTGDDLSTWELRFNASDKKWERYSKEEQQYNAAFNDGAGSIKPFEKGAQSVFRWGDNPDNHFKTSNSKCIICGKPLEVHYAEECIYMVRCKNCHTVTLLSSNNPESAAGKISSKKSAE